MKKIKDKKKKKKKKKKEQSMKQKHGDENWKQWITKCMKTIMRWKVTQQNMTNRLREALRSRKRLVGFKTTCEEWIHTVLVYISTWLLVTFYCLYIITKQIIHELKH